ncbi:MAG TPA: hypothetical protein VGI79_02025 [Caulobacteraceae bacterium]|jgi:hypothetical protein
MLFLLNDTVLSIDLEALSAAPVVATLGSMTFAQITALGCEIFSQSPRLQDISESAPTRLATLIAAKNPDINAALFSAPVANCPPAAVTVRFASLSLDMIHELKSLHDNGRLNKVLVDFHVWGKLRAAVA